MKVLQIWISLVALAVLISCSSLGGEGKRIDYGAGAIQVSALEVPPDLTVPGADERYKIPLPGGGSSVPGTGEGVATFSGYSKGGSVQGHAVLPEVPGVHLEHDASQRWLAVNENADDVWPVVRDFWLEIGLSIKSEDRAAGAMETDWAENRAKIPQGAIRSVLGKVFNKANTAGESDKYLVRLERSKDGKSTEVHITHFGMVQVYSPDMTSSRWQPRAEDPELEAIMLQRLMVRFGASEAQAASAVAAVSSVASAAAVAASGVEAIGTIEPAGTASLREISDDKLVIVINDPFDRSWRKAGLAIESSGLQVEDKDREKGVYYLRPVKIERSWVDRMKFWKQRDEDKKRYRVNVKDGGTACEVSVTDQDGGSNNVAKQMIETIFKNINQ